MQQGYKDLLVWQKSMDLVKIIYRITDQLAYQEKFVLLPQMLRSAISIPSNIAEGWSRNRNLEFLRFLEIAYASSCELETQILISKWRYHQVDYSQLDSCLPEVQKMLFGLIRSKKVNGTK